MEISKEYEVIKDISRTLSSLKMDNPRAQRGDEARLYDEPTRDPDVWPPPTPVEHRY